MLRYGECLQRRQSRKRRGKESGSESERRSEDGQGDKAVREDEGFVNYSYTIDGMNDILNQDFELFLAVYDLKAAIFVLQAC